MACRNIGLLAAVALTLFVAPLARATDDPPGVARISLIEGPASYRLHDGDDWTGVAVNAPLVTGDRFYSGVGARAEIQLAPGTYARIGADTQVDLVEVAEDATQVRVPVGHVIVRLRSDPHQRHVEIDTPGAAVVLKRAGSYRVDVESGGRTTIRVGRGEAVAHVGEDRFELFAHSSALIDVSNGPARYRPISSPAEDAFDQWERSRDERVEASQSYQHVSTDIYGVEDLDENGVWEYHRGYGQMWRPTTVSVDWAPYRDGRWVYVEPWGWTWMDYASWGWAPFHYGRWVRRSSSWYWAPGTVIARPAYSPALVAFYGYGGGYGASVSVGIGIGSGYVGWVPLGWGEPCYPWWGGFGGVRVGYAWWGGWGGPRVVNNVIINQKNIYNVRVKDVRHVNRRHPGGFTGTERSGFGRGGRRVPIGERDRRGLRAVNGRVGVTPDRSSRRAVQPSREAVGRGARPPSGGERAGMRRAGLTDSSGAHGSPRVARGGRSAASGGRSDRSQVASRAESNRSSVRSGATSGSASRSRATTDRSSPRAGGRASVAPRPPARAARAQQSSAPRRFARRSEPYVATRPAFSARSGVGASRTSPSRAPARRTERASVSRGGSAGAYSARQSIGRPPASPRATAARATVSKPRESTGRYTARTTVSKPRASTGRAGARTSIVGRSGTRQSAAPRVTRSSPPPRAARKSVSSRSSRPAPSARVTRSAPPSRAASSAGGRSAPRVAAQRGGSSGGGRRALSSGSRSSFGSGGGGATAGRSMSRGGGRSLGGSRSSGGGTRGGGSGRGRVGVGRR